MRYANALLLQLAVAATVVPVDEIDLQLLSAPDIESVVEPAPHSVRVPTALGRRSKPDSAADPVRFEFGMISTTEDLRWGHESDELPVGLQVQMKIDLN